MKRIFWIVIACIMSITCFSQEKTSRTERNAIVEGNNFFENKDLKNAIKCYDKAIADNPQSLVAMYNKALSMIILGYDENIKDEKIRQGYLEQGSQLMSNVASQGNRNQRLSSKANFNLGNVAYKSQDYKQSIDLYKQALRLDPNNEKARRNLRIAQKKQQNQDKNKDNNQQQQQQNKDEQQQQQNQQQSENQNQQQQNGMSNQNAEQILKSMENKENNTRQRLQGRPNNKQYKGQRGSNKKW